MIISIKIKNNCRKVFQNTMFVGSTVLYYVSVLKAAALSDARHW